MQEFDFFIPTESPESFSLSLGRAEISRSIKILGTSKTTKLRIPEADLSQASDDDTDQPSLYDLAWLSNKKPPRRRSTSGEIASVDLFAGCGGLSLGIAEAAHGLGYSHCSKLACDIDEAALGVYSRNFNPKASLSTPIELVIDKSFGSSESNSEKKWLGSLGDVDFLVGGPPCQGHSDLNNHTRRNDPRNDLYGIMSRAGQILQPSCIIIENVPGVQHAKNRVAQRTVSELESIGYKFVSVVLNAADYGVAQNRKRHFSIGTVGSTDRILPIINTLKGRHRPVWWAIKDLDKQGYDSEDTFNTSAVHSKENIRRISYLFDHDLYELPNEQRPDCHKNKVHSYKSVYGRMYPDAPSPTITSGFGSTGQGRFVHPYRPRTLTPHEAARVQFFPDWFDFGDSGRRQLQKLIGNAVPPKLGYVLALALIDSLH